MKILTTKELKDLQDKGEKLLVQFSAEWCGPCKVLTPKLINMSNEFENITFVKIDIDNRLNSDLIMELEIMSIPTVIIYDGHNIIDKIKGLQSDSFYKNILSQLK